MISNIYALRDEMNGFGQLFTAPSDGYARRDFASAVNSSSASAVSFAPADFALYRFGTFDSENGRMILTDLPELVVRGDALKVDE